MTSFNYWFFFFFLSKCYLILWTASKCLNQLLITARVQTVWTHMTHLIHNLYTSVQEIPWTGFTGTQSCKFLKSRHVHYKANRIQLSNQHGFMVPLCLIYYIYTCVCVVSTIHLLIQEIVLVLNYTAAMWLYTKCLICFSYRAAACVQSSIKIVSTHFSGKSASLLVYVRIFHKINK